MALGTVKWFNGAKGFGFITPAEGGADLFFHHTEIEGTPIALNDDQPVEYELGEGRKGPQANAVRTR
ncbi:cold-shock protein [Actinokineospora soli]|uniref:Cold-shock protein n=1 Tax=Actinokineospora soli TaxID=1048753 RepID=A0ABW2TL09_9PSEU